MRTFVTLLLIACILPGFWAPLVGGEKAAKPNATLKDALAPKLTEQEKAVLSVLRAGAEGETAGSRSLLKDRKPVALPLRAAVVQCLQNNLNIQQGQKTSEIAKAAVEEAKALFDPVFTLGLDYSHYVKLKREERIKKFKQTLTRTLPDGSKEYYIPLPESAQEYGIKELVYYQPITPGFYYDTETASKASPYGPIDSYTYSMTLFQQLPWGAQASLGLSVLNKETYYKRQSDKRYRNWGRPWTTSIEASLFTPLPFTANFGPHATAETTIRTQELNRDRAYWDVKTVINSTVLAVDLAYWNLVAQAQNLQATVENRTMLESLLKATKELVEAKKLVAYSLYQVERDLAARRQAEEQAWNAYMQASNALVRLLDADENLVFLPVEYTALLQKSIDVDRKNAMQEAMRSRPDLKSQRIGGQVASVKLKNARVLTRPDLSLSATLTRSQNHNVFGYDSWDKSLYYLLVELDRDTETQRYSVNYNYPLGNKALVGSWRQARAAAEQQDALTRQVENRVKREVNDAFAQLLSARAALSLNRKRLEIAEQAYLSAQELRDAGRLREFELLAKNQERFNARIEVIAAAANERQAYSRLLAAMGVLPEHFTELSARSEFDRQRMRWLSRMRQFKFFPPWGKKDAE